MTDGKPKVRRKAKYRNDYGACVMTSKGPVKPGAVIDLFINEKKHSSIVRVK